MSVRQLIRVVNTLVLFMVKLSGCLASLTVNGLGKLLKVRNYRLRVQVRLLLKILMKLVRIREKLRLTRRIRSAILKVLAWLKRWNPRVGLSNRRPRRLLWRRLERSLENRRLRSTRRITSWPSILLLLISKYSSLEILE